MKNFKRMTDSFQHYDGDVRCTPASLLACLNARSRPKWGDDLAGAPDSTDLSSNKISKITEGLTSPGRINSVAMPIFV